MRIAEQQIRIARGLAKRLLPVTLGIGVIISLIFPVIYYTLRRNDLEHEARIYAENLARQLEFVLSESPALWKYQTATYLQILDEFIPEKGLAVIRVLDEAGRPIREFTHAVEPLDRWGLFRPYVGKAPLLVQRWQVGTVEVGVSQNALLKQSLIIFLACTLVGFGLAAVAYHFPVTVVTRLEGRLKESAEAAERANTRLEALVKANRMLTASLDMNETLRTILHEAASISDSPMVRLLLLEEEGRVLRLWVSEGLPPDATTGLAIPVGESFSGQVAATREPLAIADTRGDSRELYPEDAVRYGLVSYLGLPVKQGEQMFGVLAFHTNGPRTYSQEEIELLSAFAAQAAIAIENARLHEDAVRRGEQLETIRAVSIEITRELDLDALLQLVTDRVVELIGGGQSMIRLWDEVGQVLVPRAYAGNDAWADRRLRLGEGVAGTAAQRRQGMIVNDFRTSPYAIPLLTEGSTHTAVLAEPLLFGDRLVGVLSIDREADQQPFMEKDRQLLALFASQAVIAIENARLHESAVQRAKQLASLTRLTQSLVASMSAEMVGEEVMVAVQALMPQAVARLWDVKGDDLATLEVVASVGLQDTRGGTVRFRRGEGLAGVAVDSRRPVVSRDLSQDPRFVNKGWAAQEKLVSAILFPLLIGEKIHGILAIFTREPHDFSETEMILFQSLATHAAIAIENAELHASAVRRSTELEALLLSSKAIGSSLDLDQVLHAVVDQAAAISAAPIVRLFLLEEAAQLLRCRVAVGLPLKDEPDLAIPLGVSFSGQVAVTGEPLAITDIRGDPRTHYPGHVSKYGVVSYLGLPVKFQDRVLGVLAFNTPAPRQYSAHEMAYLSSFASQAAIAIENVRLHEGAVCHGAQMETLLQSLVTITSGLDLRGILDRILDEAIRISGTHHVKVLLLDKTSNALRVGAVRGSGMLPADTIPVGAGLSGVVVQSGEPLFVVDVQNDPRSLRREQDRELGIVTYLGLPIKKGEDVLGVLTFNNTSLYQYTPEEMILLTSFAAQAAIAIENARLHEEVIQHATTLETRVRERTTELARMNLELTAALRQAEAGNQAKNDFLINMSHELRTPLNSVLGFAQLLREQAKEGLTDKQRRYLDNIYNSGQHLLAIVNEILDLDTVEGGRLTLHLTKVNLADVITEALDATRVAVRQKGHSVHALIPPDLPVFNADRDRIRQIATCLLSNAVKFTPPGGRITVAARRISNFQFPISNLENIGPEPQSQIRDFVEIAVADTGIGIRAEDLPRLFRMFSQLESPLTKRYEGTGVGLALAKRLVELHGGTITAASPGAGQGSTFTVRLPMGDPDAAIPASAAGAGEVRRAGTSTTDED